MSKNISNSDLIVWGMSVKSKCGKTDSDENEDEKKYYCEKVNPLGRFHNGIIQQDLEYPELRGWMENPERAPKKFVEEYLELLKVNSKTYSGLSKILLEKYPQLLKLFLEKDTETTSTEETIPIAA